MESSADLQAACARLLPGYERARREPERWAVLTRACLQRRPVERTGELGPAAAERFDQMALQLLLDPDADPGTLLITDLLATLYANAAYKRHLAARGNAQRVLLDSADGETHQRLARQARSWGVELSA